MEVMRCGHLVKLFQSHVRGGWLVVDSSPHCDYAKWWAYKPDAMRDMSQRLSLLDSDDV